MYTGNTYDVGTYVRSYLLESFFTYSVPGLGFAQLSFSGFHFNERRNSSSFEGSCG